MKRTSPERSYHKIARVLKTISQPARLEILQALGTSKACVRHLEVCLGKRQAYISQQLMILRDTGLVTAGRDGRNIFNSLKDSTILELIQVSGHITQIPENVILHPVTGGSLPGCNCPHCVPDGSQELTLDTAKIS
jgi:ArsR family transcriptional regulator